MSFTIAIGADHRGFTLKNMLITSYVHPTHTIAWHDVGAFSDERSDYPIFAQHVSETIISGAATMGILLCGTGTGMAIAANRHAGIYAGVAWTEEIARLGREDDHVNVLCIPADFCDAELIKRMINAWLTAQPKNGRYADRIAEIDQ